MNYERVDGRVTILMAMGTFGKIGVAKAQFILKMQSSMLLALMGVMKICIESFLRCTTRQRDMFFSKICRNKIDPNEKGPNEAKNVLRTIELMYACLDAVVLIPASTASYFIRPHKLLANGTFEAATTLSIFFNVIISYVAEVLIEVVVSTFGPKKAFSKGIFGVVNYKKIIFFNLALCGFHLYASETLFARYRFGWLPSNECIAINYVPIPEAKSYREDGRWHSYENITQNSN